MPSDDGIVVRLPDTADEPPGADVVAFDPEEIAQIVEESVGTSALFASRFRECAARALLLPRRDPRRRQPLWQQRQRAAQLLDVAREYGDFPITLEAARECLQDVFDVPGLSGLMRDLAGRKVRLVEVETSRPVAVRPLAAVRLRGRVPLRGRRAAGRAPGGRADARLRAARRAARPGRPARAARAGRGHRDRAAAAVADRRAPGARRRRRRRAVAAAGRPVVRGVGAARRRSRVGRRAGRQPPRRLGAHRRRGAVDRDRRRRPHARRARGRPAGGHRRTPTSSRSPTRSATWSPATPARTGRSPPPPARPGSASACSWWSRRSNGSPPPGGWSRASSRPTAPAPSGATPRCCACCAAGRWPRCAARSSRCRPAPSPRSCPAGNTSARRRAASRRSRRPSSSCRAPRCRRPRWSGWCCPAGWPTTRPPTSTSCAPAAKWCGPAAARSPAATAG